MLGHIPTKSLAQKRHFILESVLYFFKDSTILGYYSLVSVTYMHRKCTKREKARHTTFHSFCVAYHVS